MAASLSRIFVLVSACALLLLAGCSAEDVDKTIHENMDAQAIETSEQIAGLLTSHDRGGLVELAHSDARSVFENDAVLSEFLNLIPEETPESVMFAQFNTNYSSTNGRPAVVDHNIILILTFSDQRAQVSLWLRNENGEPRLMHINYLPIADTAINASDFSTSDWVALCLAPVTALFVLITLIAAILTRRLKRRILWSLFIAFVGYPVFGYLTETQSWSLLAPAVTPVGNSVNLQLIKFSLFSASWETSVITGHHAVNVAIPLGALVFWLQKARGKLARKPDPGQLVETHAEAGTSTDDVAAP